MVFLPYFKTLAIKCCENDTFTMIEDETPQHSYEADEEVRRIVEIQQVFDRFIVTIHGQLASQNPDDRAINTALEGIVETARFRLASQDSFLIHVTKYAYERIDATPVSQNIFGLICSEGVEGEAYYIDVTTPSGLPQGRDAIITELTIDSEEERARLKIVEKRKKEENTYIPTGSYAFILPQDILGLKITQSHS